MSVKDSVLSLLENNRGNYISGEEIADRLGVTRSSVWKAVRTLEKEGCDISAVPNRGYCLSDKSDILNASTVEKYLKKNIKCDVEFLQSVTSTNTILKEKAANGAPEGTVLIAAEQTCGRGRMERKFESPVSGVYMSILLRPKITASKALMITTAAAVAAARTVEYISGRKADIKWVNDIFCCGKKVCGILTEAAFGLEGGCFDYAVCGIGMNVSLPDKGFPEEIRSVAGAVLDNCPPLVSDPRAAAAASIINNFFDFYYNDFDEFGFIDEYISRSMVIGKNVRLIGNSDSQEVFVTGIDRECRLDVIFPDGTRKKISSGEISLRFRN